jgi:hypothetical protein
MTDQIGKIPLSEVPWCSVEHHRGLGRFTPERLRRGTIDGAPQRTIRSTAQSAKVSLAAQLPSVAFA